MRIRGFNMMRWSEDTHAWSEVETEPDHTLPYGVLAWSEDGSALVLRTARRGGSICFALDAASHSPRNLVSRTSIARRTERLHTTQTSERMMK